MNLLRTARLTLTPFAKEDAEGLFLIRGDPLVMAHWDWPGDRTPAQSRKVARRFLRKMSAGDAAYWTARTADNEFIGVFDLSDLHESAPDIGFMIRRDRWGQGYAHEGATGLISEAWRRGATGLRARTHAANARSAALLARLGFTQTAVQDVEVRPDVHIACRYFTLDRPLASQMPTAPL